MSAYAQLAALLAVGFGSSVGTVVLAKANAAVTTRARLAKALATIGAVLVVVSSGDLDGKLVADQVLPLVVNVAGAIFAGHGWWKVLVQPNIETDTGAIGSLARRTAGFGLGPKTTATE